MNLLAQADEISIPEWVRDFKSFRRWTLSRDFPERGRFSHLCGQLWVDLSMETLLHNHIKAVISAVLMTLARSMRLGHFFADGMRLLNRRVRLSVEPDAMFVLWQTLRSGQAN